MSDKFLFLFPNLFSVPGFVLVISFLHVRVIANCSRFILIFLGHLLLRVFLLTLPFFLPVFGFLSECYKVEVMFWFFIFANFCCSDVGMFIVYVEYPDFVTLGLCNAFFSPPTSL